MHNLLTQPKTSCQKLAFGNNLQTKNWGNPAQLQAEAEAETTAASEEASGAAAEEPASTEESTEEAT